MSTSAQSLAGERVWYFGEKIRWKQQNAVPDPDLEIWGAPGHPDRRPPPSPPPPPPLAWMYVSVVALSSMGFSIANASDVLHLNLRNWSAKNGKRTKWDNSTSFFTRVKPLLYFWIGYLTAKTKNQLFRQNPAQTQGSVTISNEKKTSCNQELRIMNHSIPLGASYNSRIIQTFVEWNTWKKKAQ